MPITTRLALLLAVLGGLAACTPVTQPPVTQPPAPEPATRPTIAPSLTVTDTGALLQEEVITVEKPTPALLNLPQTTQAVDDLAALLGVATNAIEVVSVEMVVWPDGSLGCPQPGMAYIQVLQDGLRIRLAADGVRYEYHSGGRRAPFLGQNPTEPAPPGVGDSGS